MPASFFKRRPPNSVCPWQSCPGGSWPSGERCGPSCADSDKDATAGVDDGEDEHDDGMPIVHGWADESVLAGGLVSDHRGPVASGSSAFRHQLWLLTCYQKYTTVPPRRRRTPPVASSMSDTTMSSATSTPATSVRSTTRSS